MPKDEINGLGHSSPGFDTTLKKAFRTENIHVQAEYGLITGHIPGVDEYFCAAWNKHTVDCISFRWYPFREAA